MLIVVVSFGGSLLAALLVRSRLGLGWASSASVAHVAVGISLRGELLLDDGPCIGCRARVAHAGEVCEFLIVDLRLAIEAAPGERH